MIRRLIPALILVAIVVAVVLLVSGGGSGGEYRIRAIFDNGSFMVNGEQVRIAGANVGTIESVSVSLPGETVAYEKDGKGKAVPGKAIIVMNISDPSFQDWRSDASCLIRPQSLIGEKFVDCRPTLPRAPGSKPAPPLKKIPSGQPGAGEYLLPLGSNGTSVDPDLINDIQTLPYAQRFRLIFNELGAGLAGRGEDLEVAIKRANPTLRDVDKLFGTLNEQKDQLAQLAANSEEILRPLSREKAHVAGFLANAGASAQASSERGPELEAALKKFPTFLREFRKTMVSLKGFSGAATPVLEDLGTAAPSLTDATRTLTPFSEATTVALKSLGNAGEASGPIFRQADPVVRKTRDLAQTGVNPTENLAKLFVSLRKTGGWDGLTELIYNTTASLNGFDQYGHFGRTRVTLSNCVTYVVSPAGTSECDANFHGVNAAEPADTSAANLVRLLADMEAKRSGGTSATGTGTGEGPTTGIGQAASIQGQEPADSPKESAEAEAEPGVAESSKATSGTEPLLNYLLGP
jgi:phospholipid/cholesterol/gamma-HCH transport system substrate-binding protein